jgi:RNA polymerase sigma factor (sigma-70 family)
MVVDYGSMQAERRSASHSQSQRNPQTADQICVALMDDDATMLDALRHYLDRQLIRTIGFSAAKDFLAAIDRQEPFDCIVSDICMPGMSGLDLVRHLNDRAYGRPVILITRYGEVQMAIDAVKNGAFDFVEKPFDEAQLLASIQKAVEKGRQSERAAAELAELRSRFDTLSARQREVMELAVAGLSSKEIGIQLNISPKTVENHRAWVLERVGARNLADLMRRATKIRTYNQPFE